MSIADFFFGRKQNSTNSRRSVKLNRNAVRTRTLSMEPLEIRDLLSVTTGYISDSDYSALRAQYPDFNLPENQSTLNVMRVDCNLSDLKSAISTAGTTTKPDLILVKTTTSANSVTYTSNSDEITINIDSSKYGSVTIIGWGTKEFMLDANQKSRIMTVSGSSTVVNLGRLTITRGKSFASMSNTYYGGGIHNSSETLTLANCIISGNAGSSGGGGIYNYSGTLTIINSTISENNASSGSAFYNSGSNLAISLINCTISGNTASSTHGSGGGIFNNGSNSAITITNCSILDNNGGGIINNSSKSIVSVISCTVLRNSATYGGGIFNNGSNSTLTVTDSTISENTTSYSGAGIYNSSGTLTVTNSTISGNAASSSASCYGGGIYNRGTLTVTNCEISGNTASDHGGGIYNDSGAIDLTNSVIVGNTVTKYYGGGIYDGSSSTLTITNCTISGNNSTNGGGLYKGSLSSTIKFYNSIIACNIATDNNDIGWRGGAIYGYNCLSSFSWRNGTDNITYNSSQPLFINAGNGNYHLKVGSQAIDKGNNAYAVDVQGVALEYDLDGSPRIVSGKVDIGAYESQKLAIPLLTLTAEGTTITASWSMIPNASSYTVMYQNDETKVWKTITGIQGTSTSFAGISGTKYNVKVKANGKDNYADSDYSESVSIKLKTPLTGLTLSTDLPIVGTTITASLIPSDATVTYEWYCGTERIANADGSSFRVTETQIGHTITCIATGTGDYMGTVSTTTNEVPLPLDAPNAPALTVEDSIITATWSNVENASSYTVWYQIDGTDDWMTITDILGMSTSFVGVAGTKYIVKVQANGTGNYSDSEFSKSTSVYIPIPLKGLTLSNYAPEVGMIITASFDQSDITADYQWYCGTVIIDGAEDSSFTVTEDQIGQTITCVATGTGNYTGTVSATTAVIPTLPLDTPIKPTLSVEDTTITATWSAVDNASNYTVEYQAAGSNAWTTIPNIPGMSTSFVGLTGTTYNVKVKANGTGNYSDSTFSESASIYIPIPLTSLTLSTENPIVGTNITTSLTPSDATVDYQWYCGTTIIDKATASSFTVTEDQIGQTITCIATGTGNYTGTVSATTAVVPALPLDAPNKPTLTVEDATITAKWSVVGNASAYIVEYQAAGSDVWTTIPNIPGTSTSFVGLTGTTYIVKVKANGTGKYSDSEFSEFASIYIPIPLTSLTLSTENPIVGTNITTSLTPSDATVDYQWYCGDAIIDGATESSFKVTTEQIGHIITCVATGKDDYTGTVSATTSEIPAIVLAPPSITSLSVEDDVVTASWSTVNNSSGYVFEYKAADDAVWSTVDVQETTLSFTGVADTTYNVRVKAVGKGYYSDSPYSESSNVQVVYVPLTVPSITNIASQDRTVSVEWNVIDKSSSYLFEYQKSSSSDWSSMICNENNASFIGDLGDTYNVRVKAVGNGVCADSDYSEVQTITIADTLDAQNDFVKTTLNSPVVIDYRDNDNTTDWSVVTVQFGEASHGEYVVNEDGTVSYTPENGFFGTDTIGYALFSPSGKASVGSISISVGLPIATSVQKTSSSHTPSSAMAPSVDSMTDWENCCVELWAQGVNELNSGETTVTLEYNPSVYEAPYFSACAEGVALAASEGVVLPNGNVEIQLTVQVLEPIESQTDNLFLGTVVLTPSFEEDAGVEDVLTPEPVCVLDGSELTTTVEAMPYDLVRNGAVDVNDFVSFATVFGTNLGTLSPDNPLYAQAVKADFNKDGIVNIDDFIAFSINFGVTKKSAAKPIPQASAAADSGNREWGAGNSEVIDSQVETLDVQPTAPVAQSATPDSQLVTRNSQLELESSMTLLEAYSAALLDLYDNQESFDQIEPGAVLVESRMESPVASYSEDSSQNTPFDVVDAVLEENLLAIDWE